MDESATGKGVTALQLSVALPATAWIAVELARTPDALQPVVLLLILLIAAVDLLPVPTTAGLDFTVSFPLMLASAILFPPAVAGLIALLGSFDIRELRGQVSPARAWFNRAQMALAIMLVGTWFHAVATPRSALWLQAINATGWPVPTGASPTALKTSAPSATHRVWSVRSSPRSAPTWTASARPSGPSWRNHGYVVADHAVQRRAAELIAPNAQPFALPNPHWLDEASVRRALADSHRQQLPFGRR